MEGEMNGYAFVASLVASLVSLAWPLAFVAVVWMFRTKITELMPAFRFRHGEWEASFRLDQAEVEAAALPPEAGVPPPPATPDENDRFVRLAEISPRAAIMEMRADLEEAVVNAFLASIPEEMRSSTNRIAMHDALRLMRSKGTIDKHLGAMLDDLRAVGNAAAHNKVVDLNKDEAFRFRKLAEQAISSLAKVTTKTLNAMM